MKTTIDASGVSSTRGPTELDVRGKLTVHGVNIPEQVQHMSITVSEIVESCLQLKQEVVNLKGALKSQQEMIETLEKKVSTSLGKSAGKSAAKDS